MADTILGHFVWHELLTTDIKSAAAFFTKVAGWKTKVSSHNPSYTMFIAGRRPVAGLMLLPEDAKAMGAPPNWCTYIGTPDVDGTARLTVSLGGRILKPPEDIPTYGRFAVLQDPQSAAFAVYTPAVGEPAVASGVSDFSWHELATTDWRSALAFYQRLFGWETTSAMEMGPELGTYQMFGQKGKPLGGMYNRQAHVPQSNWLPYIRVADSKKTADLVKKLRGHVLSGPMEVPGGDWIFVGSDLQGATFAVHSAKPADVKKAAAAKKPAAKKAATKVTKKPAKKKAAAKRSKGGSKRTAQKAAKREKTSARGAKKKGGAKKKRR